MATNTGNEMVYKKTRKPISIPDYIRVLEGNPLMYQCKFCEKKFKTKAHINYHAYCHDKDAIKPYKCSDCDKSFASRSHFEYHGRVHKGELPFPCEQCGKRFNQRGKLNRHQMSVHSDEKPFACDQCHRRFTNKQNLATHTRIHTGERPYACTICDKRFTGMTNLKKHTLVHTGERPFECEKCGKSFGLKWTLDLHSKTHSKELPFACDQCAKAFSNSKDLRRHQVIHSGERPWKCFICNSEFGRSDNLRRHIIKVHETCKEVAKKLVKGAGSKFLKENLKTSGIDKVSTCLSAAVTQVACSGNRNRYLETVQKDQHAEAEEVMTIANKVADNYGKENLQASGKEGDEVSTVSKDDFRLNYGVNKVDSISSENDPTAESMTKAKLGRNRMSIPAYIKTLPGEGYHCIPCGKKFRTKDRIYYHAYNCQTNKDEGKCAQGRKGFGSRKLSGDLLFPCRQCGKRFNQRSKLMRHKTSHTAPKSFSCSECHRTFGTVRYLKFHRRTIHETERPWECWICGTGGGGSSFGRKIRLERHIMDDHNQPLVIAKKLVKEVEAELVIMRGRIEMP